VAARVGSGVTARRPIAWNLALALVAVLLVGPLALFAAGEAGATTSHQVAPPEPKRRDATGVPALDNIYYGAEPGAGSSGPVLVFVHGLGGLASDWWGPPFVVDEPDNDMYAYAFSRGYRTAFVTLNDSGERSPGNDKWINGKTLATQIRAIASYYRVDRVNVVAHSKGGVDTHAAITGHDGDYEGVASLVRNVFTLSTPHQGSELADFAVTDRGRGLISQVGLPFDVDGALSGLTTANMAPFRQEIDSRTQQNAQVRFFTAAGTDWGPKGEILRVSGGILGTQYGPSDGLVTVASSRLTGLPCSRTLFIQPFSHFNIHMGRNSFPWIQAAMQRYASGSGCSGGSLSLGAAPAFSGLWGGL
jgi:pimeloyl-ACP methyl ester carboxylesterase